MTPFQCDRMPRRSYSQCGPDLPYAVMDTCMRFVSNWNCKGWRKKHVRQNVTWYGWIVATLHDRMHYGCTDKETGKKHKKREKTRRWYGVNNVVSSKKRLVNRNFFDTRMLRGRLHIDYRNKITLESTRAMKAWSARTSCNNQLELVLHKCSNLQICSWDTNSRYHIDMLTSLQRWSHSFTEQRPLWLDAEFLLNCYNGSPLRP